MGIFPYKKNKQGWWKYLFIRKINRVVGINTANEHSSQNQCKGWVGFPNLEMVGHISRTYKIKESLKQQETCS